MKCEIVGIGKNESFEELMEAMAEQSYWVRFFMRPCCPPPGAESARNLIERLKLDIDARADLSDAQRDELKAVADQRLEWYLALPVRHTA